MYLQFIIILTVLLISIVILHFINLNKKIVFYKKIKSFLINLSYRKDRLERFENTYNLHKINYEVVPAINAKFIDVNKLIKNNIIGEYGVKSLNKKLREYHHEFNTIGAVGCYLSHLKVWKKIKETKDINYGLVFEDDIEFNDYMYSDLIYKYISELPNDWDILLLNKNRVVMSRVKNNLFKVSKFICLHSYVIKKSSIDKILNEIIPINQQIDFKLSCLAKLGKINIYLHNDIDNKKFYKQYYSSTDIQTDTQDNASWLLNCSI